MVDWISYLNALELLDSNAGLKLKASQIAELNKQFGADPNFAIYHDKDHGVTTANLMLFFPMLILALREQGGQIKALESLVATQDVALKASRLQLEALATAVSGKIQSVIDNAVVSRDQIDSAAANQSVKLGALLEIVNLNYEKLETEIGAVVSAVSRETETRTGIDGRLANIERTLAGINAEFDTELASARDKHAQTTTLMNMFKSVFEDEPYVRVEQPASSDMINAVMIDETKPQ